MVGTRALKRWRQVHSWTSLICTLFLLILCITGLPLIFSDEIEHWDRSPAAAVMDPAPISAPAIDRMIATARQLNPGRVIVSVVFDRDDGVLRIFMAKSWAAYKEDRGSLRPVTMDLHTEASVVTKAGMGKGEAAIRFLLGVHEDLFLGLPGTFFLLAMALLFVTAIGSGIVIYGPFTRTLDFGAVRSRRVRRTRWLDLHNLLGVTTLSWALVVGLTGGLNELSTPLFNHWRQTDVAALLAPWAKLAPPSPNTLASAGQVYARVSAALPRRSIISLVYPGSPFGSPHHYVFWTKGNSPLTARLLDPVLVEATSGKLSAIVTLPWYLRVLELSRPLHFGDYGGMPLKILWALLDLVTIAVLGSGLYLWIARPRRERAAAARQVLHGASTAMEPAE